MRNIPSLRRETQAQIADRGFHVGSLWQIPATDGRSLKRVAEKGDPWTCQLFFPDVFSEGKPVPWYASFIAWGRGATPDDAVIDALRKANGAEGATLKLEAAIGHLVEVLRGGS